MPQTYPTQLNLPSLIRLSVGTAIITGLANGKLDAKPTTAYLMTYRKGKCRGNCGFCPQARGSKSSTELLSRINWPTYPTATVLNTLGAAINESKIRRVCIQALNYPEVFLQLGALVKEIKKVVTIPISVSCQPLKKENIQLLKNAGVDRIGIALDAATEIIFNKVKGADIGGVYNWKKQFSKLNEALKVFGKGNVSTHLIVGLGETEKDLVKIVQQCVDLEVLPALFAFTPIRGTSLEKLPQPSIDTYRRVQLARYLITNKYVRFEDMHFDVHEKVISFGIEESTFKRIVSSGTPFLTSGCPDCNRPFYNEKPSGPLYNYPREINSKELEEIKRQLFPA